MALAHTNQNITNARPSDMLGGKEIVIRISSQDIQPEPQPDNSITMQPEDPAKPLDTENSFHDAMLVSLSSYHTDNRLDAFWQMLEKEVAEAVSSFQEEEVPYGLLRWAKRA